MKYKMNRKDLLTHDDIWNAVIESMGADEFPTESEVAKEVLIVFNYYSELEGGGHEYLLNYYKWYIEEVGIDT